MTNFTMTPINDEQDKKSLVNREKTDVQEQREEKKSSLRVYQNICPYTSFYNHTTI